MIEYSAGIVTAYGSAVRAGYTGTYEDFCRQQAQYADNALAVEQAKQTAVSSAQTANQAKQDAQIASTTAQQSAQSAQGSAQSAGQSAQDAQTAKNNAQTYAQSASQSAGSAQQSAQTAQAILESIPEDYSDLSEDVDQLKADLGALSDMSSESALGWTWELGSYTSGGVLTPSEKRVRSGKHILNAPLTLYVEDGYRFYVHYYASEDATSHDNTREDGGVSGWITTSYTIDANTWFAIVIAKTAESGEYTASTDWGSYVYSVVESVLINTVLSSKTLAESNELRLDEIEAALANDTLPDYWTTYLDGKKSSIVNALADIGNHGDVFTYFTDYHAPLNAGHTAEVLGYINDMVDMRKNVFGGDILTNHSKSDALSILNAFASDFKDLNLLSTNGNHEYNRYSGDTADRLTDAEWYAFLLGDNELDRRISFMSPKGYYYVDNSVQKIRYLFLNTNYSFTQFSVDTTQIRWIISTLNSVKEGWGVVIFTHWYYGTVNADYTLSRDGIGDAIKAICDGFASKTTGTVMGVQQQYNVDFDFTNANGEMICVICGHTHNDFAEQSESGYWVIATMCDAYHGSQQNPAITRTLGNVSEQAIDLYFIDRTERKISIIRIGAGSDRTFTY